VAPDQWADYPHHYGKSGSIRKYILQARRFFLCGELSNAYFSLGVALHYVQDSYTSLTSRSIKHQEWEEQIEQSHLVGDLQKLVAQFFHNKEGHRQEYTLLTKSFLKELEGKNDTLAFATLRGHHEPQLWGAPAVDLNFAFRASLSIVKSVLSPRTSPKLQTELNRALAEYEIVLRETENAFADKILELIRKRDELKVGKKSSGFFATLKIHFSTLSSRIYNWRAESKVRDYEEQKHLKKVVREYHDAAQKAIAPHKDWYNITIPEIDINIVEKELLSRQEVSRVFGIRDNVFKYLVEKGKISCYPVRNRELIKKSELQEALRT